MSWYRDPQLFLYAYSVGYRICRFNKNLSIGTTFRATDVKNDKVYSFSDDLSLGNNKESDYDVFLSDLKKRPSAYTGINSQGWVFSGSHDNYVISREDPGSHFYSLPGILQPVYVDKQDADQKVRALEKKVSDLETTLKDNENKRTAQVSDLQEQLKREMNDKEALRKRISELTSKVEESCGVGGGLAGAEKEPWITGHPCPGNWVSYDDLDVGKFPMKTHKVMWVSKLAEDNTTNVQPRRFHLGMFPVVAVNVAELIPDNENARFDPDFWGLYKFAGTTYAARKPFETEMLVDI